MTRTFGLTGGIATGKSTVGRRMREVHGLPILDLDQVARDIVAPGTPGLDEVAYCFGAHVLTPDGALDRAAMRSAIATDPDAKAMLERITHPRIWNATSEWLGAQKRAKVPLVGVEAALMVETRTWRRYDALVVVTCAPDLQLQRLIARDGMDEALARRLIAAQAPLADKEAVATHLIRNDADEASLFARVDEVVAALRG